MLTTLAPCVATLQFRLSPLSHADGDARRPTNSFSGIRVLDLGPNDIVDIPYINGDLEVFSDTGTVLTGFHLTGVTVVSSAFGATSPDEEALRDAHANAQNPALFVGELMTFKCCDQDFSEYIWAPNGLTYAIGDYVSAQYYHN